MSDFFLFHDVVPTSYRRAYIELWTVLLASFDAIVQIKYTIHVRNRLVDANVSRPCARTGGEIFFKR